MSTWKRGEYREARTDRLTMHARERNGRESSKRKEDRTMELAGRDPRSFAALCRQNKLLGFVAQNGRRYRSVVFAIIAVAAIDSRGGCDR